jgi:hypothetical protein
MYFIISKEKIVFSFNFHRPTESTKTVFTTTAEPIIEISTTTEETSITTAKASTDVTESSEEKSTGRIGITGIWIRRI